MGLEKNPLTEAVYYILLALCEPRHGYGIMQFAAEMTSGRVNLGAGTVYGAINTLLEKQWIRAESSDGLESRKKSYQITALGRQVLEQEISRLKELVESGERVLNNRELLKEGVLND